MANFDDAVDIVKKCFDTAAAKTGEALELSKRYMQRVQIEKRIDSLYQRLGKAYFAFETGNSGNHDIIDEIISEIEKAKKELDSADDAYENVKAIRCPSCGKKNPPKSIYCNVCGERFE